MATLNIIFVKQMPKVSTLYTPRKRVGEITVRAKKMTKSWLNKNYGRDTDVTEMYYSSNPKMWVTRRETRLFGTVWDLCPLGPERLCNEAYDYIAVVKQ